jgi:hypothetical protein
MGRKKGSSSWHEQAEALKGRITAAKIALAICKRLVAVAST